MDINLLVLNVGNSRLSAGVFSAGGLEHVVRVPHSQQADWPRVIQDLWDKIAGSDSPAIAGVSVNPAMLEPLEHVVEQTANRKVQWVGRELEVPIDVLTDSPEETGLDRVLNIAAAYEQIEKACVVVDAGSAITIDACNEKGAFLGGAIAPGARMMLDALHEKTAKLPRVELEIPRDGFGASTTEAIRQGVYHGIRGMVKELVEQYAVALGRWPDVIATGGDAEKLFSGWELIHAIAPDLTLYGVALAYVNHHLKHGS
jgi:type III pantothenate kinase